MYRKGAAAIIMNKTKEILLVNLESFEDKYFTIPGGGVNIGETLEEAIYREIKEELNLEKKHLEYVGKSRQPLKIKFKVLKITENNREYDGSERYFFGFNFIGVNDTIKVQKGEVRYYKWVSLNKLKNYLLFDNQLKDSLEKISEIFHYTK